MIEIELMINLQIGRTDIKTTIDKKEGELSLLPILFLSQ